MKAKLSFVDLCSRLSTLSSDTINIGIERAGVDKSGLAVFRVIIEDTIHMTNSEVIYKCGRTLFLKRFIVELDVLIAMIEQAVRESVIDSEKKRIEKQIGGLDGMYMVDCRNIPLNGVSDYYSDPDSYRIEAPIGYGMVRSNLSIAAIILKNSDVPDEMSVDYRNYVVSSFMNENCMDGKVDTESFASYYTYQDWYDHVYLNSPLEKQRKNEIYKKKAEKVGVVELMNEINDGLNFTRN